TMADHSKYGDIPGLLFYLSGEAGFDADFARGGASPTFLSEVKIVEDGVRGRGFECGDYQKFAYKAPGNIYAARGTLSFFWRSRYPAGPTEFPVFRVAYADHSSWDACWLRIDYNGSGFEAMITDINLSRARVAAKREPFPAPGTWTHLALSWDETWGIRFYINGKPAAEEYRPAVYFAGLDQFGPHSRIISNWNVISDYNYVRGGDIDELVIYDRALSGDNIASLANAELPRNVPALDISLDREEYREEWLLRQGFNRPGDPPAAIPDRARVRKVEIHEAFDRKRWWWKALDGIRETTWPGVYNRSRLKGRNDYFQLPDWDCYSVSGKSITFTMPNEEFNHIEISGSAFGKLELLDGKGAVSGTLFSRPPGQERTSHDFSPLRGGRLRFTNELIEEPIGDFSAFSVGPGDAPGGLKSAVYTLRKGFDRASPVQKALADFIRGRYAPYERGLMRAVKEGNTEAAADPDLSDSGQGGFPFVNIIVPYDWDPSLGLDGLELALPGFPSKSALVPLAVQIKDPLWYYRNLAHFSFSAESGRPKRIWFDLRDRILPKDRALYLTIASADPGFGPSALEGAGLRLVYKSAANAKAEHCADRFTQVRDVYGHLVEEQPGLPEFDLYNRFMADVNDLLDADPGHKLGQYYYYDKVYLNKKYSIRDKRPGFKPDYKTAPVPAGLPAWAFKQIEFLRHYKHLINFYIDRRQIENGEFGGGLSDDGDYTAMWVGLANMDSDREKVIKSHLACLDAFYEQGMFTNGLPSIQCDELHSAEEGLIALGQALTLDFANPKLLERAMETARSLWWLTGINKAGHRHIRSSYYSGSKMAVEWPWGIQRAYSPLAITPASYLVRFNGNGKLRKLWVELAEGLLAHLEEDGYAHGYIRFEDDASLEFPMKYPRARGLYMLLYPAYRFTGDRKFFDGIPKAETYDEENMFAEGRLKKFFYRSLSDVPLSDKEEAAETYEKLNFTAGLREYYNTLGYPWIDRVYFSVDRIQYDRLGGVSHKRGSCVYPMNRIRWEFRNRGDDEKVAILSPCATDDLIKLVVYNLSEETVRGDIIGFEVKPGKWRLSYGVDTTG
ncbi:MAG: LamG domain-containing protein, partial [Treponema sp.]|nr:LamG domain-containing protein [Treponema sp.]